MPNGKDTLTPHNFVASASDLCRIIKTCAKYKVSEVRIGELELVLTPKDKSESLKTLDKIETKSVEQAKKIGEEALSKERLERIEEDLEELKLTDPLSSERLIGGELGDVGTS